MKEGQPFSSWLGVLHAPLGAIQTLQIWVQAIGFKQLFKFWFFGVLHPPPVGAVVPDRPWKQVNCRNNLVAKFAVLFRKNKNF